jgi:predicted aspartyl protease
MADGTVIHREVTEAVVQLAGQTATTIVVLGEERDQALIGAYTLEGLALCADPVNRRLVPMDLIPAVTTSPIP